MATHRSNRHISPPGLGRGARVTALSAAAGAAAVITAVPALADPAQPTVESAGTRVDQLYAEAERATEKYNATAEKVDELREQVERAQDRAARGQAAVNRMRGALAAVAGAQYRSAGLDPTVALILSENPEDYLDKAATLDRISNRHSGKLRELLRAQRSLAQQRTEAGTKLTQLEHHGKELQRHKKAVQSKLGAARRLLNRLTPEERSDRERASRSGTRPDGVLPDASQAPSGRAGAAVAAARGAVGRPYVWGAAGPSAFDCAGLTQWAYAQAGVSVPRTSQGQAHAGRRVPLSQAQPGDLVVYRGDASHVAMYVGNGQVVHAPYPGAQVRYDPVNMMPVSAVSRP
ncbi:NlpC/P60 family protein [Streptomyces sp. 549]|uniref:C40 family peptidase n=1 Tax=Streptomyces sp. 549 TaxID=3049076 RepID=UPI0024C26B25|nr:C40 family peptidase [Streptomyces sp. 549]MDK1475543.1 NlpC/P60 family protein [Streptomyces sp. 549]